MTILSIVGIVPVGMDDPNPMGLPVYHTPGTDTPGHRCAPRILAVCCGCGGQFSLCDVTRAVIDAILGQSWLCTDCTTEA